MAQLHRGGKGVRLPEMPSFRTEEGLRGGCLILASRPATNTAYNTPRADC